MLAETGNLTVTKNWSKTGWHNSFESPFTGSVSGGSTFVIGTAPGFVDLANQDFHLVSAGQAVNAGTTLNPDALPANNVILQYVKHQSSEARPVSAALDLGAYEFAAAVPMQILTGGLPVAIRQRHYAQTVQASGGSGSFVWSVTSGTLPPGLSIDPATGVIHGRARLKGSWAFTLTAQDVQNASATASRSFTVDAHLNF